MTSFKHSDQQNTINLLFCIIYHGTWQQHEWSAPTFDVFNTSNYKMAKRIYNVTWNFIQFSIQSTKLFHCWDNNNQPITSLFLMVRALLLQAQTIAHHSHCPLLPNKTSKFNNTVKTRSYLASCLYYWKVRVEHENKKHGMKHPASLQYYCLINSMYHYSACQSYLCTISYHKTPCISTILLFD